MTKTNSSRHVPDPLSIPPSLEYCPQWVAWQYEERDGKPTKVPINPHTLRRASSTDPATWGGFNEAMDAFQRHSTLAGVGFTFSKDDPFCGVDVDNGIDPATGTLKPWAQSIVDDLNSYTEISPSGHGVKVFVRAKKQDDGCRRPYKDGQIEIYDSGRFFTVTGRRYPNTPLRVYERHKEIAALCRKVFGKDEKRPRVPAHQLKQAHGVDAQVLERARRGSKKFDALWRGEWEA